MTILAQNNFDSDTTGAIASGWVNIQGDWKVSTARPVSGLKSFGSSADSDRALYSALAARMDMEVQTDFVFIPSGGGAGAICHMLRFNLAGTAGYEVLLLATDTSSYNLVVRTNNNAAYGGIGDAIAGILSGLSSGDIIHMASRIVGNTITVYTWKNSESRPASPQFTGTSTAFTTAGYPGIFNVYFQGNAAQFADNFVYTDAGASVAAPGVPAIGAATAGAGQATIAFTPADANATSFTATWSNGGSVSGASSPLTLTGLTAGVAGTFHVSATNTTGTSANSAESNSVTPTAVVSQLGALQLSPYNWNVLSDRIVTVNPGAWFKVFFSGSTCTLNFATASGNTILYRIDRGPLVMATVTTSVVCDMTGADSAGGVHLLEVWFRSFDTSISNRWGPNPQAPLSLTSIVAGTLSAPEVIPARNILVLGDSITEGIGTVTSAYGQNATLSWGSLQAELLGANVGVVGFASQGWTAAGQFSVPIFGSTWNYIYSGVTRTFSPAPDLIILLQGQNDGGANVTSVATAVLTAMLAATPSSTKIVVLSPLSQNSAGSLQAAVSAVNNSRLSYISTAGFKMSGQVHPYFTENLSRIAPSIANAVSPVLTGSTPAPTLTSRTVSVTLGTDASTPAANLTGLKVSFFDEASPDLHTVARYKSSTATTNASGVLTFTAQSTLSAGASGYLVVQGASGLHYNGTVVVS